MDRTNENLKQGQRVAFAASLINLILAGMKGIVGVLCASPILVADAIHSIADLLAHAASGVGLWMAARGKSAKFPYGLYRAETLACLVVGILIVLAGIEILEEGIEKLFHLQAVEAFPLLPIVAGVLSCGVAFFVARMEAKVGKAIGSQSLVANSREAVLDIFTSLIVVAGIFLAYFQIPYVEGAIIILIALLLFKLGIENIWTSILILLDANLDPGLQAEIEKTVSRISGVKQVGNVKIRKSGPFKMVECVISTRPTLSLYKAHELADKVEALIATTYNHIESVFVHMEPAEAATHLAMVPVHAIDGLDSVVHPSFARAPFFAFVRFDRSGREITQFLPNTFRDEKLHAGVMAVRVTVSHRIDLVFSPCMGEICYHMLKDHLVDIFDTPQGLTVNQVLERHRLKRLPPLSAPTRSVEAAGVSPDSSPLLA